MGHQGWAALELGRRAAPFRAGASSHPHRRACLCPPRSAYLVFDTQLLIQRYGEGPLPTGLHSPKWPACPAGGPMLPPLGWPVLCLPSLPDENWDGPVAATNAPCLFPPGPTP